MKRARSESAQQAANSPEMTLSPRLVATRLLLATLAFYRRWISPAIHSLHPGGCRYLPTCSEYASIAIANHGPLRGSALALWRLLRCNPFVRGGLDPVPLAVNSRPLHHEQLP
jgi:hypothetical protein